MKVCTNCKIVKSLEEFSIRKVNGKHVSECKKCVCIRSNKHYQENKEQKNIKRKKYYEDNRERELENHKKRYLANREEIRKRANAQNKTPERREKQNIRVKKWNLKNPEKQKANLKRYREKNPEKLLARQYVMWGLRLGVITKPENCKKCCGKINLEAHHKDYSKRLEVVWLCSLCHSQEHQVKYD